jgi:NADH-quinone oxidoreductase subunit C
MLYFKNSFSSFLKKKYGEDLTLNFSNNFFLIFLRKKDKLINLCQDLHNNTFIILNDISGIDWIEGKYFKNKKFRFSIIYHMVSLKYNLYSRIKLSIMEGKTINSVSSIWPGANWHEREIFDMFGIEFKNHPNLKRILMWKNYPYFPLRKDFPLSGKSFLNNNKSKYVNTKKSPQRGGPFFSKKSYKNQNIASHLEPRSHK